jgi:hypothetical protein
MKQHIKPKMLGQRIASDWRAIVEHLGMSSAASSASDDAFTEAARLGNSWGIPAVYERQPA